MAQNKNEKLAARRRSSERSMNSAVVLLTVGLVAEWYLLLADRFYARGTLRQVVGWYDYLGVMRWIGLAMLIAGLALFVRRGKRPKLRTPGAALACAGAFFAFTSFCMRLYYPTSVTVMCVLVPVLLILGIVYLFYQAEFVAEAAALAMGLGALVLLSRSGSAAVRACAVLALAGIAALAVCILLAKRNGGALRFGKASVPLFGAKTDYRLALGVPALCFALVLAALLAPGAAFYATWVLGVLTFVLAVYYTIKLM